MLHAMSEVVFSSKLWYLVSLAQIYFPLWLRITLPCSQRVWWEFITKNCWNLLWRWYWNFTSPSRCEQLLDVGGITLEDMLFLVIDDNLPSRMMCLYIAVEDSDLFVALISPCSLDDRMCQMVILMPHSVKESMVQKLNGG